MDLHDPLTRGLFDLSSGRLPRSEGEVVVNQSVLDKGYRVGDALELTADDAPADPTIVGVAESTTVRNFPVAAGPLGAFGVDVGSSRSWLVDGGPVSWATVRQLNDIGAVVTSRAVIADPPPASEMAARGAAGQHGQHHARGARADRGDGADRGGAAGRTRRSRSAPASSSAAWP